MPEHFDLVITADWSAAVGRKPEPREDAVWIAHATRDQGPTWRERPDPLYMPTRLEAEAHIKSLLEQHAGARTLVAFDFAIGLPLSASNKPLLPVGRALCAHLAERITDSPSGVNNRYAVADTLNQAIARLTGEPAGPFWGRSKEHDHLAHLPMKRPARDGCNKLRQAELHARRVTKTKPQSPWKLAGIGSVGSQQLMGLPTVHRLLEHFAARAHLWPYEPAPDRPDAITVAELYPSLFERSAPKHWYKDARQVVDARDQLLTMPIDQALATPDIPEVRQEGWILALPAPELETLSP